MAKARGVEAKLDRLRILRQEAPKPEHLAELRQALADKSNLVAAEAAEIIGERLLTELTPDLVATFDRCMIDPEETDKLCRAKIAIIETLNKVEFNDEGIFLKALRHVQIEPRYGGSEDTAAPLRANAAFGLVRLNPPDLILLLADLLADPEKPARAAAAQALGASGLSAAIPLLRFKARLGNEDPEVVAECLSALMTAAPKEALPFVAEFLEDANDAVCEGAAFALAETRRPDALDALVNHWPPDRRGSFQEVLLLAISMTRLPAAVDFLLRILGGDDKSAGLAALSALGIHRHNEAVKARVAAAVHSKKDAAFPERFKKKFEAKEPL